MVTLVRLGPDRRIVSCADLVDWFYSYSEFTKLWNKRTIANAISRAVAESEAGYTVGLIRHADSLTLRDNSNVHIGTPIHVDEIDLSDDAALLLGRLRGRDRRRQVKARATRRQSTGRGPTEPPDTCGFEQRRIQPTPGEPKKPVAADVIQSADLSARLNRDGLFDLQQALAWLRDKPATVTVDVRIHVEGELPRTDFPQRGGRAHRGARP